MDHLLEDILPLPTEWAGGDPGLGNGGRTHTA